MTETELVYRLTREASKFGDLFREPGPAKDAAEQRVMAAETALLARIAVLRKTEERQVWRQKERLREYTERLADVLRPGWRSEDHSCATVNTLAGRMAKLLSVIIPIAIVTTP